MLHGGFALHNLRPRGQLADEAKRNRQIIEHLSECFYRSSLDGRQLSANPALVKLNGFQTEEELLKAITDIGKEWYVDPQRRDEFQRILFKKG
jgi:PAS domain-containing protein